VDSARNSYRDEFIDFLHHISSHALSHFSHGPDHHSYGFGSQESSLVLECFGVNPRSHRGVRPSRRHGFPPEVSILTLSRVTLTIHAFPIMVHVPLTQIVRCKGL
jgi:hypothetical protein